MTPAAANSSVRDAALEAHAAGLSVVRVKTDGTKMPDGPWKSYQSRRAPLDLVKQWYDDPECTGLGAVLGNVSGHVEAMDFDEHKTFQAYIDLAHATGLGPLVDRIRNGFEERTPSGGVHWPFRVDGECLSNQKLACRPKQPEEMQHPKDKTQVLIETRGEGGFLVLSPSNGRVHPSGGCYTLVSGGFATIAVVTPEERQQLYDLARTFDQMPDDDEHDRQPAFGTAGERPGDMFAAATDWHAILEPHGWQAVYRSGGTTYWRRPGKTVGVSATTNHADRDLFYCFTTSSDFQADRGYSKFTAYAILNHGGSFSAAAAQLAKEGFGAPRPTLRIVGGGKGPAGPDATVDGDELAEFPTTDLGNAERLAARHGGDLRYCHPWQKWLHFDGQRWCNDDTGDVRRRAAETVRATLAAAGKLAAQAGQEQDQTERKRLTARAEVILGWAIKSEAEARLNAIVSVARSIDGVPVLPQQLNQHPWLLNVENGTLDLESGEFREHRRDDLLTQIAPVTYDPRATAPTWERFLDRIFGGDAELIGFMQRFVGYCLTGNTSEHVLPILHGNGQNGKSTFITAVLGMLGGDYSMQATADFLMAKSGDGNHPTELADLFGVRFVAAVETEAGRRLAESLLKQLTGGDRIRARRMREDFWEFSPSHKLMLVTNHKPVVRGTDHAIWRRLVLVPFNVTIPPEERDRDLDQKLRAERAGLLNWALRGVADWRRHGLNPPKAVNDATAAYRQEQDILAGFLEEMCVTGPARRITVKALYEAYVGWADRNGEKPEGKRRIGDRLRERGYRMVKGTHGAQTIEGLDLIGPDRPQPDGGDEGGKGGLGGRDSRMNANNALHEDFMPESRPPIPPIPPNPPDAATEQPVFVPSHEWQTLPSGVGPLPPGVETRMDLSTGTVLVRWPDLKPPPQPEPLFDCELCNTTGLTSAETVDVCGHVLCLSCANEPTGEEVQVI